MKTFVKRLAAKFGLHLATTDRFGMEIELDLARFTANAPLQVIFDVGANAGQTAIRFNEAFPSASIFSFEPVPDTYARLVDAVRPIPSVTPVNSAMSDTVGTALMNIGASSTTSSLNVLEASVGTIEVALDTVDHFCDSNGIDTVDFLKIDVEGFELQALRGAEGRLLAGKIRYIYAECVSAPNPEMPHTGLLDLHDFLVGHGFCFVNFYAESFDLRLGCCLGNVLYAFRERLPPSVPGRVANIV